MPGNEKVGGVSIDAEIDLSKFHGDLQTLTKHLEKLDPSLKKTEQGLHGVERRTHEAGQSAKVATSAFGGFFRQFTAAEIVTRALYRALTLLKTAFTAPIQGAAEFESLLAQISTVVEGSTKQSIKVLGDELLKMSKRFPKTPEELGLGLYKILQSGVQDAGDAMKLLEISTKAAIGGVTEVGTASKVATDIMSAYNLTIDETGKMMDAVFVGAQRGKAEFSDLASSLGNTLQSASALDVQIPEVVAAIETMVNAGLSADEAATSLNAFFTSVINASKGSGEAADLAKRLGLEFDSTALRSKGLQKFMEDMTKAIGGDEVAMQILSGSVRGFRASASIGGKGAEFFTETLEAMRNEVGALDSAFNKNTDTLKAKWQIAVNKFRASVLEAGLEELPEMRKAVDDLSDTIDRNDEAIRSASQSLSVTFVTAMKTVVENAPPLISALATVADWAAKAADAIAKYLHGASMLGEKIAAGAYQFRANFPGGEGAFDYSQQIYRAHEQGRLFRDVMNESLNQTEANILFQQEHGIGLGIASKNPQRGQKPTEPQVPQSPQGGKGGGEQTAKALEQAEKRILQALAEQVKVSRQHLDTRKEELEVKRKLGILTAQETRELDRINRRMDYQGDRVKELTDAWEKQVDRVKRLREEIADLNQDLIDQRKELNQRLADIDRDAAENKVQAAADVYRQINDLRKEHPNDLSSQYEYGQFLNQLGGFDQATLSEAQKVANMSPSQLSDRETAQKKQEAIAEANARMEETMSRLAAKTAELAGAEAGEAAAKQAVVEAIQRQEETISKSYPAIEKATRDHVQAEIAEYEKLRQKLQSVSQAYSRAGVPAPSEPGVPAPGFADGGVVRGLGGPKDDNILARLSPGETVVDYFSSRIYAPVLDMIRNHTFPIPKFANGGVVNNNQRSTSAAFHFHGRAAEIAASPSLLSWHLRKAR